MLNKKNTEVVVKIGTMIVLIIAILSTQSYLFYTVLRWVVCLTLLFSMYNFVTHGYKTITKPFVPIYIIILIALIALFNPFIKIHLDKIIWKIIDCFIVLLIFSSLKEQLDEYTKETPQKKNFIHWIIGLTLSAIIGFCLLHYYIGNPVNETCLIINSNEANARSIGYSEEEVENENFQGLTSISIEATTEYKFKADDGKWYYGVINDDKRNKIIKVKYLSENPEINRASDEISSLENYIIKLLLGIIVSAAFIYFAINILKNKFHHYRQERMDKNII